MLIGKGGEGKSRIGLVMRSLLGINMNMTSIQKIETNRFSRADLENRLLMVDDDMDMSALPKTNYIKSIVTSECKMDVERKGIQSYQSLLYVRFLCFGNGVLTALHDRSNGFYRRQIVLTQKSFANHLAQYAESYHLIPENNIYIGKGKRCRGYRGVEVIDHDNPFL